MKKKEECKKCVCGEELCLGMAEVEIGGICHRPNDPCYVIDKPSDLKEECKCGVKHKKVDCSCDTLGTCKNCMDAVFISDFTTKKMEEFDKLNNCHHFECATDWYELKEFLSQSIDQARQHERELIKKKIAGIKKENLSNKTWDEYAEGYNDARKDIKNIIEKL